MLSKKTGDRLRVGIHNVSFFLHDQDGHCWGSSGCEVNIPVIIKLVKNMKYFPQGVILQHSAVQGVKNQICHRVLEIDGVPALGGGSYVRLIVWCVQYEAIGIDLYAMHENNKINIHLLYIYYILK